MTATIEDTTTRSGPRDTPAPLHRDRNRLQEHRRIYADALRDAWPVLIGIAPFGMVLGVTMARLDISPPIGMIGGLLIFGGSAQLALLSLFAAGAGVLPILLTVALVNARFSLYAATLEPHFRLQPRWFRWIGPHFIVDQNYGLAVARRDLDDPVRFLRYWLTVAVAMSVVWIAAIGSAMSFGRTLPADSPLAFASVGIYVALLVPRLGDRPGRVAAGIGAAVSTLGMGLPRGAGLFVGVLVGIAAASWFEEDEEETR